MPPVPVSRSTLWASLLPLLALAMATFGIGTTEFVVMGLLPDVARDLGVNIPRAGLLVSGYALGVTIGAPIMALLLDRLDRRRALLLLIGMFILGNLLCALAPSYGLLMAARILTALCHAAFIGLGAVVAAAVVPPHRGAEAIAVMFAGMTIANVLGVPLGTLIGQGIGWRATFWAVTGLGLVAALGLAAWLPRNLALPEASLWREARSLVRPQVLVAMLISTVSSASLFSVLTYITPILEDVTGIAPAHVSIVLLLFGVGLTVGNLLGGRLGDWRLMPAVIGNLIMVMLVMALFTETSRSLLPAVATVVVWGVLAFALIPPLQMRVVSEAEGAPNLASTINQGAFNLGNAIGAGIGGLALTHGTGYAELPWIGAALAGLALLLGLGAHMTDLRRRTAPQPG
jgi:DHA1 family inner membrane transport protein